MGLINHNAVVATTWDKKALTKIRAWVINLNKEDKELFLFGEPLMNHYATVILTPDGSKEGWEESYRGDKLREEFITELKKEDCEDGSSSWAWVEIGYGEYGQKVLRGNNENRCSNKDYEEDDDKNH